MLLLSKITLFYSGIISSHLEALVKCNPHPPPPGHVCAKENHWTNILPHGVGLLTVFDNTHKVYSGIIPYVCWRTMSPWAGAVSLFWHQSMSISPYIRGGVYTWVVHYFEHIYFFARVSRIRPQCNDRYLTSPFLCNISWLPFYEFCCWACKTGT